MHRRFLFSLLTTLLLLVPASSQTVGKLWGPNGAKSPEKFVAGEVLVKFRAGRVSRANSANAAVGGKAVRSFAAVDGLQLVRLNGTATVRDAISAYALNPDVEYAEPNFIVTVQGAPSDPLIAKQWALSNPGGAHAKAGADINALGAWDITTGSSTVVIAVIDTGVDYLHPDLAANIFTNTADCNHNGVDDDGDGYVDDCHGIDTVLHTSDPMDNFGHGTHVAGIVGAVGDNGVGVSGVNWNVQILPCKFLDSNGYGGVAGAIECLSYVKKLKERGVNIVATNNSWGGFSYSAALEDAIASQRNAGILFVAAAGNNFVSNDSYASYPANILNSNVISVASTTDQDRLSDFSNVGRTTVHLGAPGEDILSTLPAGEYGYASGTSMAAPYVSGVIGLLKAKDPSRDWKKLKELVLAGGDSLPELVNTITRRRLNAFGSLACSTERVYSRLKPQRSPAATSVGTPITISYMDFTCSQPSASLQATVAETGDTILLKDDGVAPDEAANDGIWTANWSPQSVGAFTINVQGGDSFVVEALTPYRFVEKVSEYRNFSGTSLDLKDDEVATLAAPFPIRFGGASFDKLFVSSNGTISFSDAFGEFYNRTLPLLQNSFGRWNAVQTTTLIAPWWDDLFPVKGSQQNVFWQVTGNAPSRELVIEWRNVGIFDCHSDTGSTVTFEVVFKENSSTVDFEYANTRLPSCYSHEYGRSATIGLQTSSSVGTQWSFMEPLVQIDNSIRFQLSTDPTAPNPMPTLTALVPNHVDPVQEDVTIVVNGTNFVPGSHVLLNGDRRATTYVSPTELHAIIQWYDRVISWLYHITVENPAPGGGTSNELPFGVGPEPPFITSIVPASVPAGHAEFDLTIKGTGLANNNGYIVFNNQLRNITSATPTEIHAKIFASDVAKAGTYGVMAWGWGGWHSNIVDFTVTAAAPTQVYDVGHGRTESAESRRPTRFLGWTTRYGKDPEYMKSFWRKRAGSAEVSTDVPALPQSASAIAPGTSLPGVYLNPTIAAGFIPTGIVVADFNKDGNSDWAVANGGDSNVYIYLGRADGKWEPARIIPLRGVSPVSIVGADLRKNGSTDLVLAEADSGTVGVLLSNGDGSFEPEMLHYVEGPLYFANVGDFNGDGIPDILYGIDNFSMPSPPTGGVSFFPGLGKGEFGPPTLLLATSFEAVLPFQATVADLSKTGRSDVILADLESGAVVYENTDKGMLKRGQVLGGYNSAVGDLDEDGCPDAVLVKNYAIGAFGHCDGTFEARPGLWQWGLGVFAFGIQLADVNGDGHLDIVAGGVAGGGDIGYGDANGGLVSVSFGNGKGWFDYARVYPAGQGIYSLGILDINHDGKPDIITANQDTDSLTVLINDGSGGFGPSAGQYIGPIRESNGGGINDPIGQPLVFDINGDGKKDILLLTAGPYADSEYPLVTVLNEGNGKFSDPVRSSFLPAGYSYPNDYAIGDFRKSGKTDVLVALNGLNGEGYYAFAENLGNGGFKPGTKVPIDASYARLAAGDFDGDGNLDAVVVGFASMVFLHSNGNGTFTSKTAITVPAGTGFFPGSVWAADLNHDNKLDLVVHRTGNVVPYNDHNVMTFLGNGDGTFQAAKTVVDSASQVVLADINQDSWLDIIDITDSESSTLLYTQVPPEFRVYLGQPNGSFVRSATYDQYKLYLGQWGLLPLASGAFTSAYSDYDGDRVGDIAALQITASNPRRKLVHFLKGMNDGTYIPTFTDYSLGIAGSGWPKWAGDFDGDGKTDLLEYDGYNFSFHILRAIEGRHFDARLLINPIKGGVGKLRVTLAAPSTAATQFTLSTSDAKIAIAPAVTIPAGSVAFDVPFSILTGFDMNRQFTITARSSGETVVAYGVQVAPDSPVGYRVDAFGSTARALPGGDSFPLDISVFSIAGYSGHITMECAKLPAGATCQFIIPEFDVTRGGVVSTKLIVHVASGTTPGDYAFEVQAKDGVSIGKAQIMLHVDTFSLIADKAYIELMPGGTGSVPILVTTSSNAPIGSVTFTCSVGNNAGNCGVTTSLGQMSLTASAAANAPLGSYPIELTATSGGITSTKMFTMHVIDVSATLSTSTLSMKPGTHDTVTLQFSATNGLMDNPWVDCTPTSSTISCNADSFSFASGAKTASTLVRIYVPYNYQFGTAVVSNTRRGRPLYGILLAISTLLPIGICLFRSTRRRGLPLGATLILILSLAFTASCGGGGGPSSGGGGGTPIPQPTTKTEVFTLTLHGTNFTKTLGTVSVTVTK